MDKISFGKEGEDRAAEHLLTNGYQILTRNFRSKVGEIDIVAKDGNVLVFVEVKTRTNHEYGYPEEAVTYWKLRAITRTGQYYKLINPKTPDLMRIDVVAVDLVENTIRLLKNVSQ